MNSNILDAKKMQKAKSGLLQPYDRMKNVATGAEDENAVMEFDEENSDSSEPAVVSARDGAARASSARISASIAVSVETSSEPATLLSNHIPLLPSAAWACVVPHMSNHTWARLSSQRLHHEDATLQCR